MSEAPLADIRVVTIESWMAVPSASAILSDMGASVIKIEPLSGDPMRGVGRPTKLESPRREYDFQFDVDNRGKRSIALALDTEAGQKVVRELIAKADIFMCNLLVERQQKFGLNPQACLEINPKIVHATFTGYGTTGPDAWRPGYDVTAFFGRSGLYDAMREGQDGVVPQARPAQGDHTSGLALLGAVLAALRLAEKTGEGQVVETSLLESAVWTQASDYAITAVDKAPVRQRARTEMIIPTANRYPCGDGKWVVFNMPEISAWPKFCQAIGRSEWLDEERYQDLRGRYQYMAEIVHGVDEALSVKSRDEWGKIFDEAGFIWGPVLSMHEVVDDPQAQAVGLFPELSHEVLGQYPTVNIPMRFHTAEVKPRGPSPTIGEHNLDILLELGYDETEIQALKAMGTIQNDEG